MYRYVIIIYSVFLFSFFFAKSVFSDTDEITKGLEYLKSKQQDTGKISTGFSNPSAWSAVAFAVNNIDVKTVKKSTNSLHDYLLTDMPTNDTPTEWETRILAIVAIGENPTNFQSINYVQKLESHFSNGQIGDACSLNDDIFGLLALIAAGNSGNIQIKQDTLAFLISKQDTNDGGFGFSAPGCSWYSTSADMTGAGLHALIAAKNAGISHTALDSAIEKSKNYLLTNQNTDGGFGYFGSSDTDTTGWVLIGLNAAGMQNSEQATKAKTYLLSQQSSTDGGFMAFDWGANTMVSNATTTAQSLIAVSGNTWLVRIYTPSPTPSNTATPSATVTPTPTITLTPTPTPKKELTSISQNAILYQTITITTTPSPKKLSSSSQATQKTILGTTDKKEKQDANPPPQQEKTISQTLVLAKEKNSLFLWLTGLSLFIAMFFIVRKYDLLQRSFWKNKF